MDKIALTLGATIGFGMAVASIELARDAFEMVSISLEQISNRTPENIQAELDKYESFPERALNWAEDMKNDLQSLFIEVDNISLPNVLGDLNQ
mgnify:CR=1 FL=1